MGPHCEDSCFYFKLKAIVAKKEHLIFKNIFLNTCMSTSRPSTGNTKYSMRYLLYLRGHTDALNSTTMLASAIT